MSARENQEVGFILSLEDEREEQQLQLSDFM